MVNSKINGQIQMIKECLVAELRVTKILWEIKLMHILLGRKCTWKILKLWYRHHQVDSMQITRFTKVVVPQY